MSGSLRLGTHRASCMETLHAFFLSFIFIFFTSLKQFPESVATLFSCEAAEMFRRHGGEQVLTEFSFFWSNLSFKLSSVLKISENNTNHTIPDVRVEPSVACFKKSKPKPIYMSLTKLSINYQCRNPSAIVTTVWLIYLCINAFYSDCSSACNHSLFKYDWSVLSELQTDYKKEPGHSPHEKLAQDSGFTCRYPSIEMKYDHFLSTNSSISRLNIFPSENENSPSKKKCFKNSAGLRRGEKSSSTSSVSVKKIKN